MKAPFSFLPALPVATGLVVGIVLFEFTPTLFCMIAGVGCVLAFFILYFTKRHYLSLYILSTAAGLCCSYADNLIRNPVSFSVPGNHFVKALVIEDNSSSDLPSLTVELLSVDSLPTFPYRCIVYSTQMIACDVSLRSTIAFRCHIKHLSEQDDVPFEHHPTRSMYYDGVSLIAYPLGDVHSVSPPPFVFRIVNELKAHIYRAIVNSPINGDTAAFLVAVILGERHYLNQDTVEDYKSLGVAHILALSGLHVGVIASFFAFLIWPIRLLPHYRALRVILLLSAVWSYTVICGFGDSILRAAIMISLLSLSGLLQRSYYPANALLLAIAIILAISPSSLFSPGFQLSVTAVLSIIVLSPVVPKKLKRHPVIYFIANMVVLPIAAMLGTALVSAYHFSTFPTAFLLANIIVGLIFPYILIGGVALSFFTAVGIEIAPLGHLLDFSLSSMNNIVDILCRTMPSPIAASHFSAWAFVPYAAAVGMIALAVARKRIAPVIAAVAFFIITFTIMDFSKPAIPMTELYIIRHPSTCILIRSGKNAALITTCRDYDTLSTRQIVESRHRFFLRSRDCAKLISLTEPQLNLKGFSLSHNYLDVGESQFLILNNDSLTLRRGSHTDYLFVGQKFSGNLRIAIDAVKPDSIILAADIHPSRRKRFLNEIIDQSRVIDLRSRQFALVYAE